MKRIILFLAFGLAFSSTELIAQSSKKVKNFRIKSTTEWIVVYNGDEKSAPRKDCYLAFDKDGNTVEKVDYNKDGSIRKRETAKFDNRGNLLEETSYEAKNDKDLKEDNNKKVIYKYNDADDKTEENVYDLEGKLLKRTAFTYNRNGDKSAEVIMDAAGKVIKKSLFTYDAKGLKLERKSYNSDNVLESVKKYEYIF